MEKAEMGFQDYKNGMKYKDIAAKYDVSLDTVKSWKRRQWSRMEKGVHTKNEKSVHTKRKRGGQPGNKNATGPPGNRHAEKHGFFTKWLPKETMAILNDIHGDDPLDLLWDNIQLQYAAIVRAQQLMHVKDQQDKTLEKIETKDGSVIGEKWEVQQAWDKHATFMSAQSRAMKTLESMIKNYEEILSKQSGTASEEQRARINQLKAQTKRLEQDDNAYDDGVQDSMDAVSGIIEQMQPIGDDEV